MNQIIQNEVECLKCGDIIFSRHTHDFATCSCGNVSVDGGLSYIHRSWKTQEFEERSLSTDRGKLHGVIELINMVPKSKNLCENISDIVYYHYGINGLQSADIWGKITKAAQNAIDTNKNIAGIIFTVIRAMRDNGVLNMEKFNGNQ